MFYVSDEVISGVLNRNLFSRIITLEVYEHEIATIFMKNLTLQE